MIDKYGK